MPISYHTFFNGQEVQVFLDFLALEVGIDMCSRNVGTELPFYAA